ncbi:MAG: DUF159 family protein [Pseudohongiella sp.]|nr:DUF159 family protein [Pseudohongiella sp.]|tara:strand:- start:4141 stop:4836 length:696 start_codon:yes stop_codon:yes gene_type:complete
MCGRYNIVDSLEVRALLTMLGVDLGKGFRFSPDIAPGATVSIIREVDGERIVSDAIWWLLLDPATLKPNYKYASFNTRSDKLDEPRAAGFRPYRESRCIIPASAFVEGLGDGKTYHKLAAVDQAIAFGGLCREWVNKETGETALSVSIITLPPLHDAYWKTHVHPKSMPLMLPTENDVMDPWLDRGEKDVEQFRWLLEPILRAPLVATPIDRPSTWRPIGGSKTLKGDGGI